MNLPQKDSLSRRDAASCAATPPPTRAQHNNTQMGHGAEGNAGAFKWYVPSATEMDQIAGDWTLHNICVGFQQQRFQNRQALFKSQFVSLNNEAAVLWGFTEYLFGFTRLAVVRRPDQPGDEAALKRCEHRKLGLAMTMSSNNLYHQFFHAAYAYLKLQHHATPDAVFVPLVAAQSHAWLNPLYNRSHAWEFSVRPYTTKSSEEIIRDTFHLIRSPCTCFERLEGATGGVSLFNPSAVPRLLPFCRGALKIARSMPMPVRPATEALAAVRPSTTIVLYVSRKSNKRVFTNDAEVVSAICGGTTEGAWQGVCASLETLSLVEQMRMIGSASVFVGAHGQAMAWMPFLLCDRPRAAVVEVLMPRWTDHLGSVSNPNMYGQIAKALGPVRMHHRSVRADMAPGCNGRDTDVLACNMTAKVAPLMVKVREGVEFVRNTTALPAELLL